MKTRRHKALATRIWRRKTSLRIHASCIEGSASSPSLGADTGANPCAATIFEKQTACVGAFFVDSCKSNRWQAMHTHQANSERVVRKTSPQGSCRSRRSCFLRSAIPGKQSARHTKKCYLASNLNRAGCWLYAGNHVEPEEEIRNFAYFHAHDSDLL